MKKYSYSKEEREFLEKSCLPFSIYQWIDDRVETLVVSQGFVDMFGAGSHENTYDILKDNLYKDVHPEDISRLRDAAYRFYLADEEYNLLFRNKIHGEYRIVRAKGQHVFKPDGYRLAVVWFSDEGAFLENPEGHEDAFAYSLSRVVKDDSRSFNSDYDHLTGLP